MASLFEQINQAVKDAMRAGDTAQRDTLRLAMAEIKRMQIDAGKADQPVDDAAMLSVLTKMVKQRDESIAQFAKGGRDDLVAIEEAEKTILQQYLPAQLSEAEVLVHIEQVIVEQNASSMQDMGKVMQALKAPLAGRADMGWVSQQIKAKLS